MELTQRWLHALTLAERSRTPGEIAPIPGEEKNALAAEWATQPPFDADLPFVERLAADGLTEAQFVRLLNEKTAELGARFPEAPDWVAVVRAACAGGSPAGGIAWPENVTGHGLFGFIRAVEPLIAHYLGLVRAGAETLAEKYEDLPFDPATIDTILLAPVPENILRMASRTLILELNVARVRGQLTGETPEARYQEFFERLREPAALLAFFDEYVVLAHQLAVYLGDWADGSLEFLERLCADWGAIRAAFAPGEKPGKLARFASGLGDLHNRGRSVGTAHFDGGFRVVYKPRPLQVTAHFQDLLAWLNAHGLPQRFRKLRLIDRGGYGWTEFIAPEGCRTAGEVALFYERQGGYLALLYALSGTDVHAENLIAAGEHPMLIDVETLFQPVPADRVVPAWIRPAFMALQDSVMRSLLLPVRMLGDDHEDGIDFSGLGAQPGQLYPTPVPYWEGAGTDEMHLAHRRVTIAETTNRPTLNGQEIDVAGYVESIVSGFEMVYRFLLEHRAEFMAEGGPLARFAHDEVRIILRSTRIYASLVHEGYHPNLLRDALHQDRLFDYLWRQVPNQPSLRAAIASEKLDLHRGNVPFFASRPHTRDLWDSAGACIPGFFPETSMADARRRIERMGESDLENQVWLIRASFLSLPGAPDLPGKLPMPDGVSLRADRPAAPAQPLGRERLLAAAAAAGDRVEALALCDGAYAGWIGLTPDQARSIAITPAALDLYGGLPGIALFLAYLGSITGERRYTALAEKALFTARDQLADSIDAFKPIGAFAGWGGILYMLTHLAALWGRDDLFAAAEDAVGQISARIEGDERLDVIGGAAGCIGSLLGLCRVTKSARALETALRCGDHLLAQAKPYPNGAGWLTTAAGTQPVTGFAHGGAGMAWALSTLAEASGEGRFCPAAEAAIAYERGAFSEQTQNWHSLRGDVDADDDMVAWCYGAPGIGLARLNSPQTDPRFAAEIETSLWTTLGRGIGHNYSLCHGDLGNLELALQASRKPGGEAWRPRLETVASAVLDGIDKRGWVGGTVLVTGPGLMTGISGIGYQLLRLAEPGRVPSVLTLAPPAAAG